MKKIILSLAILAATSITMMAANDNNTKTGNNGKPATECCKQQKQCDARADKGMKAFEGLDLTDAQKTKLAELRKQCKARKDAEMKQQGAKQKENKENLSAEQKQQRRAEKAAKRQQAKQDYLNGVKAILTPQQYTQFLENNFSMAGDRHGKGIKKDGKQMKGRKDGDRKAGKKGNRPNSPKQAPAA